MILLAPTLLACAGESTTSGPVKPDPAATAAAVDAVCKLVEGAGTECTRSAGQAKFADHVLAIDVELDKAEHEYGQFTWAGTIVVTSGEQTLRTNGRSYGWSKEEAYERGFHEWALVAGTAIVDWRMGGRAALAAVEKNLANEAFRLGDRPALRGWSLARGLTQGDLDHGKLLDLLAPFASEVPAGGVHTLQLTATADLGAAPVWVCALDGVASETLCTLAKSYPWPTDSVWEVKQVYLVQ